MFNNFKPIDFLKTSEKLFKNIDYYNPYNSAIKRTIYSRIYYAVFLFVREWLKTHKNYKSYRDHTNIPIFLKNNGPLTKYENKELSENLLHLKKLRTQSDYYIEIPKKDTKECEDWFPYTIEESFKIAEDIINSFK